MVYETNFNVSNFSLFIISNENFQCNNNNNIKILLNNFILTKIKYYLSEKNWVKLLQKHYFILMSVTFYCNEKNPDN
jgi:hypothetical protein